MRACIVAAVCVMLVAVVSAKTVVSEECKETCKTCPVLERSACLAGVDKDPECGCCDMCSKFEGEKCDLKGDKFEHGKCGDGLECKSHSHPKSPSICQCRFKDFICGNNNKTYINLCQMMASIVRDSLKNISVKALGPCSPGAQIITRPEYVKNSTHNQIVLACEAIGFPAPNIKWQVRYADNTTADCPGDDESIMTASRGGPGKYQATGWLQISNLQRKHEGDYTCIAANQVKEDLATARIKVVGN